MFDERELRLKLFHKLVVRSHELTFLPLCCGNLLKHRLPDETPANSADNPFNEFTYDTNGKGWLMSAKDANGFVTSFLRDGRGRITQITYPDNDTDGLNLPTVFLAYDPSGNGFVTSRTDERGKVTNFTYDKLNRMTTVTTLVRLPARS